MAEFADEEKTLQSMPERTFKELKSEGNHAYKNKDYERAEIAYSKALDMPEGADDAKLFANRAATLLELHRFPEALSDSERAIEISGTWIKGYHRKCQALKALGRVEEAFDVYKLVQGSESIEHDREWLASQLLYTFNEIVDDLVNETPSSIDRFCEIFSKLEDMRLKLSTLARFWNASTPSHRLSFFRNIALLAGSSSSTSPTGQEIGLPPSLEGVGEEQMVALPLDNYSDVREIDNWMAFFEGLELDNQLTLLQLL